MTRTSTIAPSAHPSPAWPELLAAYAMAHADMSDLGDDYEDEEANFYCDALTHAQHAVFFAPAPDGEALARKLEIYLADEAWEMAKPWQHDIIPALIADARRLSRGGRHGD